MQQQLLQHASPFVQKAVDVIIRLTDVGCELRHLPNGRRRKIMTLEIIPLKALVGVAALTFAAVVMPLPAAADAFTFSTGSPDGRIATLSRPNLGPGLIETETADDFILSQQTSLTQATFTGLIPSGASVTRVEIEFYHVFPTDSAFPPSGNVVSRTNSPGDVEIAAATRDSLAGTLSFSTTPQAANFPVLNTVVNGIHKQPNQFTGGEGPTSGQETQISVNFLMPVDLPADHYFFRPEAALSTGNFLWLSAAGPPLFTGDLQTWIRNEDLKPDWERVGTDVTHQGPFNASFSLTGVSVPGPIVGAGLPGLILACGALVALARRRRQLVA
jgi:hypothetical protein